MKKNILIFFLIVLSGCNGSVVNPRPEPDGKTGSMTVIAEASNMIVRSFAYDGNEYIVVYSPNGGVAIIKHR